MEFALSDTIAPKEFKYLAHITGKKVYYDKVGGSDRLLVAVTILYRQNA